MADCRDGRTGQRLFVSPGTNSTHPLVSRCLKRHLLRIPCNWRARPSAGLAAPYSQFHGCQWCRWPERHSSRSWTSALARTDEHESSEGSQTVYLIETKELKNIHHGCAHFTMHVATVMWGRHRFVSSFTQRTTTSPKWKKSRAMTRPRNLSLALQKVELESSFSPSEDLSRN
jgi:hypothetical protein